MWIRVNLIWVIWYCIFEIIFATEIHTILIKSHEHTPNVCLYTTDWYALPLQKCRTKRTESGTYAITMFFSLSLLFYIDISDHHRYAIIYNRYSILFIYSTANIYLIYHFLRCGREPHRKVILRAQLNLLPITIEGNFDEVLHGKSISTA